MAPTQQQPPRHLHVLQAEPAEHAEPAEQAELGALLGHVIRHVRHIDDRTVAMADDIADLKKTQAELKRTQQEHSDALANISATVIRIETRLSATEQTARDAVVQAARVSTTNELVEGFARVALDEQRDEIQARRDQRAAVWGAVGKGATFVFSVAGAGLLISAALKACGYDEMDKPVPPVVESASEAVGAGP